MRGARAGDLGGAVNDARALAKLLRTRHGFARSDIRLLLDERATRQAILAAIQEHLIDPARPGQVSLFFFAGHGSFVSNPGSAEPDRRDETIVPADANRGTADLRDKELAVLFNQILDRGARFSAIFDSCHSGSIARGLPGVSRARTVPSGPWKPDLPSLSGLPPEERGALIFSAAQDGQLAQERYVDGQYRGLFSAALEKALATEPVDVSADRLFVRVRALMQGSGSAQEPVLAGIPSRRRQTLWGIEPGTHQAAVAVSAVQRDHVLLQAGHDLGLGSSSLLRRLGPGTPVQLLVTKVLSPSQSLAVPLQGDARSVQSGDLFEVEHYGAPTPGGLRLFLGSAGPEASLLPQLARELQARSTEARVAWIWDPTESAPTHVLSWLSGQWSLRDRASHVLRTWSARPPAEEVLSALREVPSPRLFVQLPVSGELRRRIENSMESGSLRLLVADPTGADYLLVGRWNGENIEYAWIHPQADVEHPPGLLPVRSRWLGGQDEELVQEVLATAIRLERIHRWQTMTPPHAPSAEDPFPYKLALRSIGSGQLHAPEQPLLGGQDYQLLLLWRAGERRVQPRYVYVFHLDEEARATLLFPPAAQGNVENLLPPETVGSGPQQLALGAPLRIEPPYGWESFILLTSETAIPNAERAFSPTGARGVLHEVATRWSIERQIMRSRAP